MKKKHLYMIVIPAVVLFILAFLQYKGIIWFNSVFAMKYEVKGLDVSHYQGDIDWEKVSDTGEYKFVFMKATEGHDFTDNKFFFNWNNARKQGILTGAYHFFSMRSSGEEQATHFINIVPKEADSLPPVIDIEIHLKHDSAKVRQELRSLADALEKYYEKRPILYVTYATYNTYIKGEFEEYHLWIRDILKFPTLGNRKWLFWQYCNRGHVEGIDTYVDKNVFKGSMEEFRDMFKYGE